jgi:hypothetical protein
VHEGEALPPIQIATHFSEKQNMATKYTRTKAITLPTFSHKKGGSYFFRVLGEIHAGKAIPKVDKDGKKVDEKPADLMHVVNLDTGEEGMYMVPTLVKERMREVGDYVGKCYEITFTGQREGKRYKEYAVYEIADPAKESQAVAEKPTTRAVK